MSEEIQKVSYATIRKVLLEDGVPLDTIERFIAEYCFNPAIWAEFQRLTLRAIALGRTVGAKAIMERIRWEVEIEQGDKWKCNNNFTAYYARVFAVKYPQHADYFEFRQVKGLKAA